MGKAYEADSSRDKTGISSVAECVGRGRGRAGDSLGPLDRVPKIGGRWSSGAATGVRVRGTTISFNSGLGLCRWNEPVLDVPVMFGRILLARGWLSS